MPVGATADSSAPQSGAVVALDPAGVRDRLRHRPPFLFVDRAEVAADGAFARAVHVFTADQAFFEGHFPGAPVVPGVLLIELVAQTANLLLSHREGRSVQGYLVGVDETRFNRPVPPDRTVVAEVRPVRAPAAGAGGSGPSIVGFKGQVAMDGRRCLRATVNIYRGD